MLTQAAKARVWDKSKVEMTPDEREYVGDHIGWRFYAKGCELHIGLGIPRPISIEIHNWAEEQDWPDGTELEPIEEYHITMFYSPEGYDHKDDPWMDHEAHAVSIKGIKEFPSKECGDKDAIVLTIDSETIGIHHNELAANAEDAGIEISPYSFDDFKPHMTIAYGSLPKGLKPPHLTFETEVSSVLPPRDEDESSVACDGEDNESKSKGKEGNVTRVFQTSNDKYNHPSQTEDFVNNRKHDWSIARLRPPYEAELLKLADSWQPRDSWPNALRERAFEPHTPDCTCDDGEKLSCPVHGMHPTLPTWDDTLEFPNPSSPVGYDNHADGKRTWMRAETKVTGNKKLFLDDTRHPPEPQEDWDWAKDAAEAKKLTKEHSYKHMSLDHDLGIVQYEGKVVINPDALSGGDFALWLHEHKKKYMPKSVNIHSHNGKGTDLMKEILEKHTDVTTDRAADDLEEDWAREFKVHEPSEIEKEVVHLPERMGKETPAQQQNKWHILNQEYPSTSQTIHQFPEGWSIQEHDSLPDVNRIGQMMRNCWQNEDAYPATQADATSTPLENWHYQSLHDPSGLPRAAFFVRPNPSLDIAEDKPYLGEVLGPRNHQVDNEASLYLKQYAAQNGYRMDDLSSYVSSKTASHQLAWLPHSGLPGKGLVTPDGSVHTWPVSDKGFPDHAEYMDSHAPYELGEGSAHFFNIRPRGGLDTKSHPVPAEVINHIFKTVPSLRAGEHTDWHFAADEFDTRQYQDSRQMPPMMQTPNATNPHPEGHGCTCPQGEKLSCPVHGLNPDPTQQGYDHSWSIPEGHPVGLYQQPDQYMVNARTKQDTRNLDRRVFGSDSGLVPEMPRNYMKAECSVEDRSEQHDAKTHGSADENGTTESTYNGRESDQENGIGIDHWHIIAAADPRWLSQWIKGHGPYAYHGSDEDYDNAIAQHGLLPWNQLADYKPGPSEVGIGQPRPDHVYMTTTPPDPYDYSRIYKVDLRKLDPHNLNPDEDWYADAPGAPMIDSYSGQGAEDLALGVDPTHTHQSMEWGKFAHRGPIPPEAISIYEPPREEVWSGWTGLPRAEGAADEAEHEEDLEGSEVAMPRPPQKIRKKRKEQEDPLLYSGAWRILSPTASRQSRLDT